MMMFKCAGCGRNIPTTTTYHAIRNNSGGIAYYYCDDCMKVCQAPETPYNRQAVLDWLREEMQHAG